MIPAALAFWIACLGCAPAGAQYYVAPSGTDNGVCTEAQPCTPQGAVKLCFQPDGCRIDVADGDYPNPAIDIFYRRTVLMIGNCNDPAAVRLHATQPNAVLITVQDHATAGLRCMTFDAEPTATGVTGVMARQHVIVDYNMIGCGPLPGGVCFSANEFSNVSCTQPSWLTGDFTTYIVAGNFVKLNVHCEINTVIPIAFSYFLVASDFTAVSAQSATFSGAGATGIGCVKAANAIVYKPLKPFPGDRSGNC
jgi:hypothetical protein